MEVSVVIPVYNADYLVEALESVFNQTLPVHEVICIDDASTADIRKVISNNFPATKLLRNEVNMGPSYSRNRGIKEASGTHIAFLDADDQWVHHKNEWQCEVFKKNNQYEVIAGLSKNISNDPTIEDKGHFNAYTGAMLVKKSVFDKIGLFDTNLRLSEDQDWFLRLRESKIPLFIVDQVVQHIRLHNTNTTRGLTFEQSGLIHAIKQSLDRRRGSGDLENLDRLGTDGITKS